MSNLNDLKNWRDEYSNECNGETITAAQDLEIKQGKLNSIKLGSYWLLDVNGKKIPFRVADRDYFYGKNGNKAHDLILVPDVPLDCLPIQKRGVYDAKDGTHTSTKAEVDIPNFKGYANSDIPSKEIQNQLIKNLPIELRKRGRLYVGVNVPMSVYTQPNLTNPNRGKNTKTGFKRFVEQLEQYREDNNFSALSLFQNEFQPVSSYGVELMSVAQIYGPDYVKSGKAGHEAVTPRNGFHCDPSDEQLSMFKFTRDGKKLSPSEYKTRKADNIVLRGLDYWTATTALDEHFAVVMDPIVIDRHNHTKYNDHGHSLSLLKSGDKSYIRPMIVIKGI